MGRPTTYTPKIGDALCRQLAEGKTLNSILKDKTLILDDKSQVKMPAASSVYLWIVDGKHTDFSDKYRLAREAQGYNDGDKIRALTQELIEGKHDDNTHLAALRLAMDNMKWVTERNASRSYGNKTETTLKGDEKSPVKIEVKPDLAKLSDEQLRALASVAETLPRDSSE